MIYAPHTFELTIYLGYKKFDKFLKMAFENAKSKYRVIKDEHDDSVHYDEALNSNGIRIMYIWGKYDKRIKLIVNPSKLLGGDDIPKLWKPNKDNISKMLKKLTLHIDNYFDSDVELDDFKLTRMDFTININLKTRENVSDYIQVLHNIGKVKGYTPVKDVDWIKKDLAFVLKGNSNNIIFWVYDKEGREEMLKEPKSRLESAKGILRVEIQISTNKALLEYTDETVTRKQIKNLAKQSEDIFKINFNKIMPRGDFYKKGKAEKLIEEGVTFTKKEKVKMLELLEAVPVKKSLLLAQRQLGSKNVKGIMKNFKELELCPVTISKRHGVKFLDSLYFYL